MARFLLDGGRQRLAVVIAVMATTANSCGVGNFNNGTRDLSNEERERETKDERNTLQTETSAAANVAITTESPPLSSG